MTIDIKIEQRSPQDNEADLKAYVYCQRGLWSPDTPVKIGSHTGSLAKLWSRYKTTNGINQELKVIEVKVKEVRAFEKAIQLFFEREGYWLELELFKSSAWDHFDRIAQPYMLPKTCISHLFKKVGSGERTPTVAIAIQDDADDFQVEDIPTLEMNMESNGSKRQRETEMNMEPKGSKRQRERSLRQEETTFLSLDELSTGSFQYLKANNLVRQVETGDIYELVETKPVKKWSAREFVAHIFEHPTLIHPNLEPKHKHFYSLLGHIKNVPSPKCPFISIPDEEETSITDDEQYSHDEESRAISFLQSNWVQFDSKLKDGTPLSQIQKHFARFQDCLTPEKLSEKDFISVNHEWKVHRPQCCVECTGSDRKDLTKLRKFDKETCKVKGHKLGTFDRRIRYLRIIDNDDCNESPGMTFLTTDWVKLDPLCPEGTLKTKIQAHFSAWCKENGFDTHLKINQGAFQQARPEWRIHRQAHCRDCSGNHQDDLSRMKKFRPACADRGHAKRYGKERIKHLRLVEH